MKTKNLKKKQTPKPCAMSIDELWGELWIIEYNLTKHARNLRAEADCLENTARRIAALDGILFPQTKKG
jgi:hypothetical protein